tara:strand:+ start:53989 stop:54312 length:324 start_codon:yes stop_codon:yes gene_type:complete
MARCVEERLSSEKTAELMQKAGEAGILDLAKSLGFGAAGLALAAPPAIGGLAAYFSNKATDSDASDIEEIKQKELVDSYRRMSAQLTRAKKLRDGRADRKRTGQVFL